MYFRPTPVLFFLYFWKFVKGDGSYTITNLIRFPYSSTEGPFIGIFIALALPLELPDYNVFFSLNMEANYGIPMNDTTYTYPPLLSRSWSRKFVYDILEFKMESHNYPGRDCLLRMICETAFHSTEHTGILGDIFHIILTPSSSVENGLSSDYQKAENAGKNKKSCVKYTKKCTVSFLSWISQIQRYINKL